MNVKRSKMKPIYIPVLQEKLKNETHSESWRQLPSRWFSKQIELEISSLHFPFHVLQYAKPLYPDISENPLSLQNQPKKNLKLAKTRKAVGNGN
jgi:hypothetical protein